MSRMKTYEIQELDIGGLLDHTIILVRDHFKAIVAALCCGLLPLNLIFAGFVIITAPGMYLSEPGEFVPLSDMLGFAMVNALHALLGIGLVLPFTAAVLIHSVASVYLGRPARIRYSLRYAFGSLPRVIPGYFLAFVIKGIGFALCFIPGLLLTLYWYIYVQVLVLEEAGVLEAFSRSARLMEGHKLKVLVLLVVLWVIGALSGISYVIFPPGLGAVFLAQILNAFLSAFAIVLSTVVYFSARCQVEHLDLDLLADKLSVGPETEGPVL